MTIVRQNRIERVNLNRPGELTPEFLAMKIAAFVSDGLRFSIMDSIKDLVTEEVKTMLARCEKKLDASLAKAAERHDAYAAGAIAAAGEQLTKSAKSIDKFGQYTFDMAKNLAEQTCEEITKDIDEATARLGRAQQELHQFRDEIRQGSIDAVAKIINVEIARLSIAGMVKERVNEIVDKVVSDGGLLAPTK